MPLITVSPAELAALSAAVAFTSAAGYCFATTEAMNRTEELQVKKRAWRSTFFVGVVGNGSLSIIGAIIGGAAAIKADAAFEKSKARWLGAGAFLLASNWAWTLAAIMPVNKKLLADAPKEASADDSNELLKQWNRLHAVRVGLGAAAVGAFAVAILAKGRRY